MDKDRKKTKILCGWGLSFIVLNKKFFLAFICSTPLCAWRSPLHCVKHTFQPSLLLRQTAVMIFYFSGGAWRWLWLRWCYNVVDDDIDVTNVDDSNSLYYTVISAPSIGDWLTYLCNVSVTPRCQSSFWLEQTKLKLKLKTPQSLFFHPVFSRSLYPSSTRPIIPSCSPPKTQSPYATQAGPYLGKSS